MILSISDVYFVVTEVSYRYIPTEASGYVTRRATVQQGVLLCDFAIPCASETRQRHHGLRNT
jgi:hypothetical protein